MDRSVAHPGEAAGAIEQKAKSKAKAKAVAKSTAQANAADAATEANKQKQSMARTPPAALELSSLTSDDCKERGLCFAFQKGECMKGKECSWKHLKAKTRDRSNTPSRRGRPVKKGR